MAPQAIAAVRLSEERLPLEVYVSYGTSAGVRWTALRELVLGFLWSANKPVGVYEAASRLSKAGRATHPTSVYRCLSCLEEAGLVLPIVTWNRYMLSPDPMVTWWGVLLCSFCRSCTPFPLTEEREALGRELRARTFAPYRHSAECQGRCRRCQGAEVSP